MRTVLSVSLAIYLLLAILAAEFAFGLNSGEVAALDALKRSFPALLNESGWIDPSSDGCSYSGVECNSDDHIVALYVLGLVANLSLLFPLCFSPLQLHRF